MKSNEMKTSLLDLKGLVMESYYSGEDPDQIPGDIKPWVNSATFGLTVFISKYYDQILEMCDTPLNMIACLDAGKKHRVRLLSTYKGKRAGEKEKKDQIENEQIDLAIQMAKDFLVSQGVILAKSKGEEADDVLAYLATNLEGFITIHTVDRDIIALANETTFVFIGGKVCTEMVDKNKITVDGVKCDVHIPPYLVTMYKSIVGDTSDNYGGVAGVGPKAWVNLVEKYGEDGMLELEELIRDKNKKALIASAHLANDKTFTKLADNFSTWEIMYQVAALAPEIVKIMWHKRAPDDGRLAKVFGEANCMDLYNKYRRDTFRSILVTRDNLSKSLEEINALLDETPFVPWDYETYDTAKVEDYVKATKGKDGYVDMLNSAITGCSFAFGRNVNVVYYFSVAHKDTNNVDKNVILNMLQTLKAEDKVMVAQNVMFEATITKNTFEYDIHSVEDTKLYSHHIDENTENGLKYLSKHYLNYQQATYNETLERFGAKDMAGLSGVDVLGYGADDSLVTGHIYSLFVKITSIEGTRAFIEEYECPAAIALSNAHIDGVNIDLVALKKMAAEDEVVMAETMAAIRSDLESHTMAPNFEAAEALFKDQEEYWRVKATKLKDNSQENIAARLKDKRTDIKANSYYVKQKEEKSFKPFIPTLVGINAVAAIVDVPKFEKISQEGIREYQYIRKQEKLKGKSSLTDHGWEFVRLLPPASSDFNANKRSSGPYLELEQFCNERLEEAAPTIMTGTELNLNSPMQRQYLFYLFLDLPIRLRTKVDKKSVRYEFGLEGSPSTDNDAILTAMANDCELEGTGWKKPILNNLNKFVSAATRKKIYWDVYPLWVSGGGGNDEGGIIHPNFSSCGTVTRRPTGTSPNLMQISKGKVRTMFVPQDTDSVICSIDFSSQELRLNADACQDPTWMSAYVGDNPKDLHAMTGCRVVPTLLKKEEFSEVEGIEYEQDGSVVYSFFKGHQDDESLLGGLLRKARSIGKTVNFACQFSSGPATLSRKLLTTEEDSAKYIKAYNETFSKLQPWKDKVAKQAKQDLYVTTAYGSRRHCNGINSNNVSEKSRWERQVCNFKIQSTASDILKVVLTGLVKSDVLNQYNSVLLASIYDEVLLEIPKENIYKVVTAISELMSLTPPGMTIPMVPDTSIGPNWGVQYEIGVFPSQEDIDKALLKF